MVNNETESADRPRLRGWLTMSVGLFLIVLGAVWTLQGLGFLKDSLMSDQVVWAGAGGGLAGVGLVLVVVGMRRRSAAKTVV
ncbi:hypothetical protein [Actinoplanes sp. NPDC051851]|uniref:hypothetical protein n=1 Tax=Actinoplanes sp. NPDC051851 TaxID=3154753 RepID=UPI0034253846